MTNLTKLTLSDALDSMAAGDFSSEELTKAHIDACMDGADLNAFITTTFEQAMEGAKASDARRKSGTAGKLEGAPLAVKDLFCTEGVKTTAGSKILGEFAPTYESTVSAPEPHTTYTTNNKIWSPDTPRVHPRCRSPPVRLHVYLGCNAVQTCTHRTTVTARHGMRVAVSRQGDLHTRT